MRLFELFNKKAEWDWTRMNDVGGEAMIHTDDQNYSVMIGEDDADYLVAALKNLHREVPKWLNMLARDYEQNLVNIQFELEDDPNEKGKNTFGITNTGNEFLVFATVIDIMKDYENNFNVDWWTFTATEPSRRKLYDRLATRFSGQVFTLDDMDGDKIYVVKA